MAKQNPEQQLIERAQQGDRRCFDILVITYNHRLQGLMRRILSNPADADDLCQDVFLRAWRALPSFRGDSAFYTWLYRIAINMARNHIRQRKSNLSVSLENVPDKEQTALMNALKDHDTPEQMYERDKAWDTICHTMDGLPKELRTAISLREVEGMSYEDIAAAMNCPVGTVRSRIFRARTAIENSLRELHRGARSE